MFLREFFKSKYESLNEGGNLAAGQPGWKGSPEAGQAQSIDLKVTNRSYIVPILNQLMSAINTEYASQFNEPLWNPSLIKSQKFLSGSSLHFLNVKGISDKDFVEKKPKVGDIDTMVNKEKESDLDSFLNSSINKQFGPATLLGYQRGNEQFSSLWQLDDPPIKIQIDLEFVKFDKDEPTAWARFSHSSDWNDITAGVKGVFHKYLIQSFAVLTKRKFILRKQEGRGKNRQWVDKPAEDSMLSFAVSSKEGGGLRAKYTPVINPSTNEPEIKDGLPVMLELPAAGYEQDINKIFLSLFGVKLNEKNAEQLADKFWSFNGLLEVMNKLLDPEEKSRVLGSFLNKLYGPGAQGLYKNDPTRDSSEKNAALDLFLSKTGAQPPEDMSIDQMRQDYISKYKMTSEALEEADDVTSPPKPNYARQGIQHIYNRLPDGRVSSMEMKDADFIDLCKEIAANGGNLDGVPINLKVDGAGIRFGKDQSGRPFMMTSKVTEPIYADNATFFTDFERKQGRGEEFMNRAQNYDDAVALITRSKFIQSLPDDTIVQAEMLFNPMAQNVDGQLKFVNIPYDPKKLGKQMTLVPFMIKEFSTGETRPDQDKIITKLLSNSDNDVKIITNKLEQKGINVSKIIDPVVNIDPNLEAALKTRGNNPAKDQAKQILDQARQELSTAIIDSPKLKGKDMLGDNMEGIVINMPSGRLIKVTSQQMKSAMATKTSGQTFGDTNTRTAVVAIGNFAGHRGHEQLIQFAVDKANELNGTPFVFVGHKVGPDDPIDINTKLETLKKLFPEVSVSVVQNQIGPSGEETVGNIFKKIEYELIKKEPYYNNIVITVGSDQASVAKTTQQMQGRYSKFPPLAHVKVSAYVTPRKSEEGGTGVSTTQLRNALKNMSQEDAFKVWSQAYNVQQLGDDWIRHLMDVARKNMGLLNNPTNKAETPKQPEQSTNIVKERLFYSLIRPQIVTESIPEKMLPKSSFAGTEAPWHHKLGPAAQAKGKQKGPVKKGQLVGEVDDTNENLRQWFKDKWVRFGPDGKIRGDCARGDDSEGKPKCLPQSKAHALGKKGRASAAARKRREDPNPERKGSAINVATKKKREENMQLDEKCWDTHKQVGMKKKGDRMVPNCVPKENTQKCPDCGGPMFSEDLMNEKKDACYYKVKARYKVWPSAYASGALVKCRKKGSSNWGKKSESYNLNETVESIKESLIDKIIINETIRNKK